MEIELIAEIGQNHNGDMALARELILCAKNNGADVAKFQVFDVDAVFGKEGNEWYEYNRKAQLSREDVLWLSGECKKIGIEFMASVFDTERIQWLEEAEVKRYKIASRSIKDSLLLEAVAKTGKPIIVSLGHWKKEAFPNIHSSAPVSFLYCVSKYPAKLEELRLGLIDFAKYSGFSDHTIDITAAQIALSRGAKIIEKHFTLDKRMSGPDHACSMTPGELKRLHKFRLDIERCL